MNPISYQVYKSHRIAVQSDPSVLEEEVTPCLVPMNVFLYDLDGYRFSSKEIEQPYVLILLYSID